MCLRGRGKTTQLGYGLGLAMGAKLARPEKLCVNVWGDAAIGFTGMDFETAVRERIPILSILLNNFSMAIEIPIMRVAQEKYGSTDISGNYADMARAFGGYGARITEPSEVVPAIRRGIHSLAQAGIVQEVGRSGRTRVWRATEIIEIAESVLRTNEITAAAAQTHQGIDLGAVKLAATRGTAARTQTVAGADSRGPTVWQCAKKSSRSKRLCVRPANHQGRHRYR